MKQSNDQYSEPMSSGIDLAMQQGALPGALPEGDSFGRFVQFLKKRTWLVLVGIALGIAAGAVANLVMPKLYSARAEIEVKSDMSAQFRLEQVQDLGGDSDDTEKLDTEIEILRSRGLALETIRTLHLESNPDFAPFEKGRPWDLNDARVRQRLAESFIGNLDVNRLGHTSIIQIHVTSKRPFLASMIANTLIDGYIEHSFRDNFTATEKISGWLNTKLAGLKDNLEKSQARMLEFQKDIGLFSFGGGQNDQGQSVDLSSLEEMNRMYADAEVDRVVKEARLKAIKTSSPEVIDALAAQDPALQASKAQLTQLRSEYTAVSQTYGPAYPHVQALKAQIDQLEASVAAGENAEVDRAQKEFDAAKTNEEMLKKTLDADEQKTFDKGAKAIQWELARRDYETNRVLYDGLQERLQEAGIMASLHATPVHIVEDADLPDGPSHPRVRLNLVAGGAIGMMLGLCLALLLEGLDTNLKTMTDIEQALQLPLLAAIPSVATEELLPTKFREAAIAKGASAWSRIAEALRGMRTSILLSSPGSPPQVIMITSTRPAEGKSSVATLIAITFALNGSRVLLIDADLRRPAVHLRFRMAKGLGLSSVLSGKSSYREAVIEWPELPNLKVLPSGPVPPLPSELLGSKQMEDLLTSLRAEYDFILIDTPPVLAVTDASILGRWTDAAILIIRYGGAQRHVVRRSVDLLERSGTHLLGVAVNVVDFKAPEYQEYYGRKYYEYYGERNPE